VLLQTDGSLYRRDQTIVAREGGRVVGRAVVPPTEQRTLTVPLRAQNGVCTVEFTAARALVPPGDPRPLAAHYLSFDYRP
jgi:predicted RNA-binding protein with PUA domain